MANQEPDKNDLALPTCEKCGRQAPRAIFACPDRANGGCPYIVDEEKGGRYLSIGAAWLGLGIIVAVVLLREGNVGTAIIAGLCALIGIPFLFNEVVWLENPRRGTTLERTTLRGIEASMGWRTSPRPIALDLELPQPLSYPPSVLALPTRLDSVKSEQALVIVQAAIIGLLAQGHIEFWHAQSRRYDWGGLFRSGEAIVLIVEAEKSQLPWPAGEVERRIHRVLMDWAKRERSWGWPEGPYISFLVAGIYDGYEFDPEKWLAQLVADDATKQGYGQIDRTGRPFFSRNPKHSSQLEQEWETLKALSHRLTELHPDLSHTLNREIKKGISLREVSIDFNY